MADPTAFFACPGPTQLHAGMQGYAPYRQRFSDRIKKHFFVDSTDSTSGSLAVVGGVDRAAQLFQSGMVKFSTVLFSESARWGNMDAAQAGRAAPFTKSEPTYRSDQPFGDWDRNTAYSVNVWLTDRRAYYLSRMQTVGFYQP